MMKPQGRKRLLLAAAAGSLLAHWLVLDGVELNLDGDTPGEERSVMMVAVDTPAPAAKPVLPKALPTPAARPSPGVTAPPLATGNETPDPAKGNAEDSAAPTAQDADTDKRNDKPATPGPSALADTPVAVRLLFNVYLGDGDGADPLANMTHTLTIREGHFDLSSRGEAVGLLALMYSGQLTQHSTGVVDAQGFATRLYTEQRGKKPETRATVDTADRNVLFSNGNSTRLQSISIQDRLSVIYQVGLLLRSQPDLSDINGLPVLTSSSFENWHLVKVGTERLRIGDNQVVATHFRRVQQEGSDKTGIELWYDTGPEAWPLQIRLTDRKGMVMTQRRQSLSVQRSPGP